MQWKIIYNCAKKAEVREYCLVAHLVVWYQQKIILPFTQTCCDLSDRYDWKKGITEELFKYTLFCSRIVWSTESKTFLKSKTAPTISVR